MPAILAIAVYCAAFSPAAVLFATVVSRRPERIVLMFLSAFMWLVSISLAAALWVAVAPLNSAAAWLVLPATLLQEAGRYGMYVSYVRLLGWLREAGLQPRDAGPLSAQLPGAAVANGVGIWIVHTLVLYGDVLWRAGLPGSLYTPMCSYASTFSVDAVSACGVGSVNVLLSLIGWTAAYPRRSRTLGAGMVGLHLLASAATALNAAEWLPVDGCTAALPALGAAVLLTGACAVWCVLHSVAEKEEDVFGRSERHGEQAARRRLNSRSRMQPER
jgi:anterior pharynx defective protein 1